MVCYCLSGSLKDFCKSNRTKESFGDPDSIEKRLRQAENELNKMKNGYLNHTYSDLAKIASMLVINHRKYGMIGYALNYFKKAAERMWCGISETGPLRNSSRNNRKSKTYSDSLIYWSFLMKNYARLVFWLFDNAGSPGLEKFYCTSRIYEELGLFAGKFRDFKSKEETARILTQKVPEIFWQAVSDIEKGLKQRKMAKADHFAYETNYCACFN